MDSKLPHSQTINNNSQNNNSRGKPNRGKLVSDVAVDTTHAETYAPPMVRHAFHARNQTTFSLNAEAKTAISRVRKFMRWHLKVMHNQKTIQIRGSSLGN